MRGAGAPAGGVDAVQEQLEWQREVYIDLHAHPGLSMHETRTSGIIAERLEGFGFEVQRLGGGVVGVLANGQGPVVMNRADFDALPVEERTGLDCASTETTTDEDGRTVPLMHACGHDMHVAALPVRCRRTRRQGPGRSSRCSSPARRSPPAPAPWSTTA